MNKRRLIFLVPALIAVLSGALPFVLWYKSEPLSLNVLVWQAGAADPLGREAAEWLFRYRKSNLLEKNEGSGAHPDFTLFAGDYSISSMDAGNLQADRMKETALKSGYSLWDGSLADESADPALRERIEEFLLAEYTGWTFKYEAQDTPRIRFVTAEGEEFFLEAGVHFSGYSPTAGFGDSLVPVDAFIPVYRTAPGSAAAVSIDLHLRKEGEALLDARGIPRDIPLILERKTALGNAGLYMLDASDRERKSGTFTALGKLFYKSRIALYHNSEDELYWKIFIPWLDHISKNHRRQPVQDTPGLHRFRADKEGFRKILSDGEAVPFYIQGVNLGAAVPGRWFTQFPENEHLYYQWFSQMKEMNFNTLRVYTLLPPAFYRALELFNKEQGETPLYLIQEIWPEEHPPGENLLDSTYKQSYLDDIRLTLDALHGSSFVPSRSGRAWGRYTADVSPWVFAYLIGRELEAGEVLSTNSKNPQSIYTGRYLSAPDGPATEVWIASACDSAISYESRTYGVTRPVGIVSWPILDSLTHAVEWNDPALEGRAPANDKAVVDINRIITEDSSFGGLFGAYHIYPNYPDFMNNQESYAEYRDTQGTFRYGAYLKDFMETHKPYPAMVAEYGISTSAATAHYSPDGYHHGGLTEEVQAEGIIRMDRTIRKEGYAGSLIFEWIDEWAKKTWTTEAYMIPYDRQAFWHNALDPEQNYGIMAMEGVSRRGYRAYKDSSGESQVELWGSESHLYLYMPSSSIGSEVKRILIGVDSYDSPEGLWKFPGIENFQAPGGMESLAQIDLDDNRTRILNSSRYSISTPSGRDKTSEDGVFIPLNYLVNREYVSEDGSTVPPLFAPWSELNSGPLNQIYNSFYKDEEGMTLRIPWGLLNVSDPSSGTVLDDPAPLPRVPVRDGMKTGKSDGIRLFFLFLDGNDEAVSTLPRNWIEYDEAPLYSWDYWDIPRYRQREKASVPYLREYFDRYGADGIAE